MKVMHLFNEIRFSGAETMYANAASMFREQGVSMLAISSGPELGDYAPIFKQRGIHCKHLPAHYGLNLFKAIQYSKSLLQLVRQEQVEAMHIHRNDLFLPGLIAWFAGIPCVKTQHNNFKNRWFTLPYARLRRLLVRKVFNVQFQTIGASVFQNELHYYKNPSIQVNNWFDDSRFFPAVSAEEKNALRLRYSIPTDSFVIVSSGSCSKIKNHHHILSALGLVKSGVAIHYIHLGDGATLSEEITLSESLGIRDKVSFFGKQTNVRDFLAAADLYVMPSYFEGLSIAALEAMACGLPSILYDSPGLRDLIHYGDCGSLIARDYNTLAETIQTYQSNTELCIEKGNAAREMVLNQYSMSVSVPLICALYNNVKQASAGE